MITTMQCIVHGKVQGVFYRASTRQKATELGICGWVSNNPDGTVTIVAEGEKDKLNQLLTWAKQGPPMANVTDVEVEWGKVENNLTSFEVWH